MRGLHDIDSVSQDRHGLSVGEGERLVNSARCGTAHFILMAAAIRMLRMNRRAFLVG